MSLRLSLPMFRTRALTQNTFRTLTSTPSRYTSAGYGDPQDEKIQNETPTPSSTPHPTQRGSTDPERTEASVESVTGNKSGKEGQSKNSDKSEVKETKSVGEKPKQEKVGGAGPIGG
jgi:hypothetical protein